MDSDGLVARRLIEAAARSGASLIAETAAAVSGWAVLVDPTTGAVYSSPDRAAAAGISAAAEAGGVSGAGSVAGAGGGARARARSGDTDGGTDTTVRQVVGAALVVHAGPDVSAHRADLVTRATAGLLEVRARRAEELTSAEMRLHAVLTRLLLHGETGLAAEIIGGLTSHATVYRLSGGADPQAAYQAVWRALLPTGARQGAPTLITLLDGELVVVALHDAARDDGRVLRLIARSAERYGLLGGVADPAPLAMLAAAFAEAGQARAGAAAGYRLVPAAGLGDRALLRIIPPDRLSAWASSLLGPLTPPQRQALEGWLRTGSIGAMAQMLGISRGTARSRLRRAAERLGGLETPLALAQLALALRAPAGGPAEPAGSAGTGPPAALPTELVDAALARRWATALTEPLDTAQRIALRVWLGHLGSVAPAAGELGLHRTTLRRWLEEIGRLLDVDLSSATVRADLYLALETLAGADDSPGALPRRGGRTYQRSAAP
ncbi:helix-turn-helix domain-containing protein [Streptomyces sp. NPDC056937]|uniref:helix-turn-helix domain-containing protein n=1 Tax=Streptomyces sp. NPDC056937 TaxID=3345969 RepID=UPI00364498BD